MLHRLCWVRRIGVVMLALGAPLCVLTATAGARPASTEQYLGRWNYDHPDRTTKRNIVVIDLPGAPLEVPQIGDIVFSRDPGGGIVGRTDQGCTWRFEVVGDALKLRPRSQTCHSPVSNLSYTIHEWTVTVSGRHEQERFVATSHHPQGDVDAVLEHGRRTKADESDPQGMSRFLGTWDYDPADAGSGVNIRTTQVVGPDGNVEMVESAQTGSVTFTRDHGNRVIAQTDDGCTWALMVRGNTAKPDPAVQTCRVRDSQVTLKFWTTASDGQQQASWMTGVDEHGNDYIVSIGALTKRRS
jgi:hypothetical protein